MSDELVKTLYRMEWMNKIFSKHLPDDAQCNSIDQKFQ